ncbi:MAG: hypothetical protein H6Q36_321 [Chloroflexi bacterium]|nr:hypothetical protein [Chloroflexota bacterium]
MRYCQACGISVPERAVYCPACGTLLAALPGASTAMSPPEPAGEAGPSTLPPAPAAAATTAPAAPSPAGAGPRSSGRTAGIVLAGIALLAVTGIGAWAVVGQRPNGAGTPTTAPSAAAGSTASAAPPPTEIAAATPSTWAETAAPATPPEPTPTPARTEPPTRTLPPSPSLPVNVGETPAEAVGLFLVQNGVEFAGICASVDPATAPEGAYCADLFEERLAEQVWRAGPVASEPDVWLLVDLTEMGWAVAGYAPMDDPSRPPF